MPEDDSTTDVMENPAEDTVETDDQKQQSGQPVPTAKHFINLGRNPGDVEIDKIVIDGHRSIGKNIPIKPESVLELIGRGLGKFNDAILWIQKSPIRPRRLISDQTHGRKLIVIIPQLKKEFQDIFVDLELRSFEVPDANGILSQKLHYVVGKPSENQGQGANLNSGGGGVRRTGSGMGTAGRSGLGGPGGAQGSAQGALADMVDLGPEILGKIVTAGRSKAKPAKPQAGSVNNSKTGKPNVADDTPDYDDEEELVEGEEQGSVAQNLPLQDSLNIVGEHLDKNSELIVDRSTRENVLQALSSGNFSDLSPQGHEALQKVVKGYASGGQGVSVQLQQASRVINNAYVSGGGRISGTAEVSTEAQVTGAAEATADTQSTISAKTSATAVSGASNLSLRQSLNIVGEYLDKNPRLIVNTKIRGKVLETLGSGNLSELDDEGRAALQGVLRTSVPQEQAGAIRLQVALQNVEGAMPGPVEVSAKVSAPAAPTGVAVAASIPSVEEKPVPQVSAHANGPKEAAVGLQAAGQAGTDMSGKPQGTEKSAARSAGPTAQPAVEPLKSPGVNPEAGAAEPQANGQDEAKAGLAAAAAIGQKVDGIGAPKGDLAAMKAALDRNNAAVAQKLGLKGAKQPPAEGGKDAAAAPGRSPEDIGAEKGPEKGLSGKVGGGSGLSKGTKGQEPGAAGSKLPSVPGIEPEVSPPLNPEELQESSEGQPEEGQEDKTEGGEGEEPEGEEGGGGPVEEAADQSPQKKIAVAAEKNRKLQAEIKKTTDTVNKLIDKYLMSVVATVWGSALPSFGLAVLLGAVVGDFLWAFKNSLVKRFLTPLLRTEGLKRKAEEIARQIKISGKVKANIAAMNLVVILGLLLIFVFVFSIIWGVCNSWTTYMLAKISGMDQVCKVVNQSKIGSTLSSMRSNGSFSASYNTPGSLTGTAQWTNQINTYAQKYNIDACILRVVVQKESSGNAQSIGHDGHSSSGDPFDLSSPPKHNLNWLYSHGIGLTQWTIFSNGSGWMDNQTPSRKIFNSWYKVTDLLDPNTSLDLTAHDFSNKLAANLNSQPDYNSALRMSFAQYNGGGNPNASAIAYADASMTLYNMCKSNNTQFNGGTSGGGGASGNW